MPTAEMFTKIMQDYRSGAGAYDALNVIPAWMPDLAQAGALEVLDPYVDKYGFRDELQKIAPTYRDNQMMVNGKIYGFPDDGDVFVMYYRKDIFGDPATAGGVQGEVRQRPAGAAQDLEGIRRGRPVPHRSHSSGKASTAPRFFREPPYTMFMFQERFRNEGGKFFDADTMKATINSDVGVKVFTDMRDENKFMPPGVEQWGFVENLAAFLQGQTAMTISWPPYGRWAAGYGTDQEVLTGCRNPRSPARSAMPCRRADIRNWPRASALSVASTCKNKEAAYLFIQWLNSEDDQHAARAAALRAARSVPRLALHQPGLSGAVAGRQGLPGGAAGRRRRRACSTCRCCRPTSTRKCCASGISKLWAGEDPKAILDEAAARLGRHHREDRRRQAEGGLCRLGGQVRRLSEVS